MLYIRVVYFLTLSIALPGIVGQLTRPYNNTVPAIFVFGDSTVDAGNNNYIPSLIKCNFAPYGINFINHVATGRFTDGLLLTDHIASYAGIKETIPAYLKPRLSLEEMMTGVSFASGASGLDPLTAQLVGAIPVEKQLEYFKEYKAKMETAIGVNRTKILIRKAVYIISSGTNDIGITYLSTPFRRISYNISGYQDFLLQNLRSFIQGLRSEGAQLIGVVGLPPIGCLPIIITLYSKSINFSRPCVDSISSIAIDYNRKLQQMLDADRTSTSNLVYADIYYNLGELISNPSKYGYDDVNTGCCGTGLVEVTFLCNPISARCSNPSKYVFFDSVHPTGFTYYQMFKMLRPLIDQVLMTLIS